MSSQSAQPYGHHRNGSPPRTPPHNGRLNSSTRSRDGNVENDNMSSRPSFPETFLDDLAADNGPAEYDSADDDRDPHDLSLSPQHAVRTSVVDNMLLSLDQFSELNATGYDPTEDADPYSLYSRWNDTYGHSRGHTFSSSLSSDADGHASPRGRYSEQTVRGRRSNSSSNFPSVNRERVSARGMVNDSQRASNRGDQSSYSRQTRSGRAHSQSSESSVDLKELLTETRISQSRHNRRSASFDYGSRPTKADALRTKRPSQDQVLQYHDIDAAPTPTVPGGPRKELDQGLSYNRTPALSRKNSGKSSKSAHNKKGRADTIGTATIRRHPDNNFDYFRDIIEDVPPMPGYSQPTAPSPTIPRHKSLYFTPIENSPPPSQPSQMSPPPAPAPAQPKERPGFFRRVFGSSKSSTPAQTHRDAPRVRDNEIQAHAKAQNSITDKQKSASPSNKLSRENAHVVTKKPSSFFRRRKKSTTDHHPPPPLVLGHSNMQFPDAPKGENPRMEVLRNGEGPTPSPVSSLRNVMKPYLADTRSGSRGHSRHDSDVDDDNHSMEIPLRNPARPGSSQVTGRGSQRTDRDYTPAQSSTRATNSRSTVDTRPTKHSRSGSFLADSSDNEGSSDAKSGEKCRRPVTSPSVPNQPPERLFEHNKSTFRDSITPNSALQPPSVPSSSHDASPSMAKGELNDSSTPGLPSSGDRDSLQPSSAHGAATSPHQTTWIDNTSSTEQLDETTHSPNGSVSTASHYQTAANTPIIPVEDGGAGWGTLQVQPPAESNPLSDIEEDQPRDSHKGAAQDEPTAAWLGAPDRAEARKAYMEQFDWSDMDILAALRGLCSKLVLKGETQQVDRILDALSARWCECNPNHGFKATDVVHTICYSLLLLNTDLHLADIEHKMTRSQFVENTMPTIQRVAIDAAPESFESGANQNKQQTLGIGVSSATSKGPTFSRRLSVLTDGLTGNQNIGIASDAGPLVNAPFVGTAKQWETQVESVLKEFYNSIQKQRLPLRGANTEEDETSQPNNLLSITGHMLRRSPSNLSKANSDMYPRGRPADYRNTTGRWNMKQRSRPRLYPTSTMGSSRTSLDDHSSIFSPTASSTWTKYSLGKTLTSMSVDSLGSGFPRGDFQQSIGFANALSHAIIREDSASFMSAGEDPDRAAALLEDETLELAGAPWAKEGSLKHKQHLDAVDKRAKDRNWNESFAVIQRGWLRLFSFNSSTKSAKMKAKQRQGGAVVVGGGNWMENAEETWKFQLRQTIATVLPPPGYSKTRPHVWALSLPTGAVHLFQCGTPDIVKEFVTTANYWSARLSKEPLSGGVSNIEYGWSEAVINSALALADEQKPPSASGARTSLQSSIRSSIDQQAARPRLPADRIHINDWTPPQQSMVAATLSEAEQLEALRTYVKNVEEELQKHNDLRGPMMLAFSPKHPNLQKAMANFEKKSSYLLREIVKFRTYIDCLQTAQKRKEEIYGPSDRAKTEDEGDDTPAENPQRDVVPTA